MQADAIRGGGRGRIMKTKHTPTPWVYEGRISPSGWGLTGMWAGDQQVFGDQPGWDSQWEPPRKEDAAFIVRACNSYDQLLAACKAALPVLIEACEQWSNGEDCYTLALEKTEAAIAAAEGEGSD